MHQVKLFSKILKIFFVLFFLITLSLKAQTAGEGEELSPAGPIGVPITEGELIKSISVHELEHPYLFFNNQDKQTIISRIKNDPESKHIFAALIAEGHRFLHVPVQKPEPFHPRHNRYLMEDPAAVYESDIMEGALTLAFLYQMTGDFSYAKKAIEFAMDMAGWSTWVDPAHRFDVIYSRV